MRTETIRTEGLGDSTYVLSHDGVSIVVDPQRDIDRFENVLNETGSQLRYVLETHLHNDYISGGRDLARSAGAELVMPSGAAPAFRHRAAFHNEDLNGGPLVVRPLHTPGHTPEHMSYVVLLDGRPVAVFTGGSLLVGSAGRSDLLGVERAESLARLQFGSLNRLASLPDDVTVYPTHGAGSFCTTSGASKSSSTIGAEKRTNPVLAYPDEDAFVEGQLSALVPYPSYYAHMAPANLTGMDATTRFDLPRIQEEAFAAIDGHVAIVDARPKTHFAAGHLTGSLAIELRSDFGTWVGWVLPFNSPLILVMNADQDAEEAARQLTRIGFDEVLGVVTDIGSWGVSLATYPMVSVAEFSTAVVSGSQILDVRAPNERDISWITGSAHRYAPDLPSGIPDELDKHEPLWLACETGYRANLAASMLDRMGWDVRVLGDAGVTNVLDYMSKKGWDDWYSATVVPA